MTSLEVAVIIPTLNEEGTVAKVIRSVPKKYRDNIIVADCRSSDRTVEIAKKLGVKTVTSPRRTYDHPCFYGSEQALRDGADILVYLHAGGDDDPKEILLLLEPIISDHADLVMGSRSKSDSTTKSLQKHQKLGTQLIIKVINLFFRTEYSDIGPFRAIRSDAYRALNMQPTGFSFPSQMLVKSLKRKLRVTEISVTSRPRVGRSKISGSVRKSFHAGRDMFWSLKFIF